MPLRGNMVIGTVRDSKQGRQWEPKKGLHGTRIIFKKIGGCLAGTLAYATRFGLDCNPMPRLTQDQAAIISGLNMTFVFL